MMTRLYSVHLDPKDKRPYESALFIPEGFNFYAFLFDFFWAAYHRLWAPAFLFMALLVGVKFASFYIGLNPASFFIMNLGIRVMIGMAANDLWRDSLERKGYILSDVVIADSFLGAARRYYDRHLHHIDAVLRAPSHPPAHA